MSVCMRLALMLSAQHTKVACVWGLAFMEVSCGFFSAFIVVSVFVLPHNSLAGL